MKRSDSHIFKYSEYDAIPVLAALAQFAYLILLFVAFPRLSWCALIPLGFIWSVSISWNINGISHNFLHNPYFKSRVLAGFLRAGPQGPSQRQRRSARRQRPHARSAVDLQTWP